MEQRDGLEIDLSAAAEHVQLQFHVLNLERVEIVRFLLSVVREPKVESLLKMLKKSGKVTNRLQHTHPTICVAHVYYDTVLQRYSKLSKTFNL